MSTETTLRIQGLTVTRTELEGFTARLRAMDIEDVWAYLDIEDEDTIVLEGNSWNGSGEG